MNAELEIEEALALWKARAWGRPVPSAPRLTPAPIYTPTQDVDRTAMLLASRSEEVSTAVAEYSDHPHTLDGAALRASPYDRAVGAWGSSRLRWRGQCPLPTNCRAATGREAA